MSATITTKFIIGNDEGINTVSALGAATTREKYGETLPIARLESYIGDQFSSETLLAEMRSFSSQFLVAYSNEEPAGYARITSKGNRPPAFAKKPWQRSPSSPS